MIVKKNFKTSVKKIEVVYSSVNEFFRPGRVGTGFRAGLLGGDAVWIREKGTRRKREIKERERGRM